MRDFLCVADLHDVPDDVPGVFGDCVIHRALKRRTGAIVVDAQSAAHVDVTHLVSHLAEFCVETGRLPHRTFDRADIGTLRAHVEMHKPQAVREPRCLQRLRGCDQI